MNPLDRVNCSCWGHLYERNFRESTIPEPWTPAQPKALSSARLHVCVCMTVTLRGLSSVKPFWWANLGLSSSLSLLGLILPSLLPSPPSLWVCSYQRKLLSKTLWETYGVPILRQIPPALLPYGDLPRGLTVAILLSCEIAKGIRFRDD